MDYSPLCHLAKQFWPVISPERLLLSSLMLLCSAVISYLFRLYKNCMLIVLNISVQYLMDILRTNEKMNNLLAQNSCTAIGNFIFFFFLQQCQRRLTHSRINFFHFKSPFSLSWIKIYCGDNTFLLEPHLK